jgi:hypothetical protein
MFNHYANHPLSSVPGVFALAVWSIYLLYAALFYPDVLSSVLITAFFGLLACLAVVFNFRYWRSTILLASSVYLLLYVIRIVRMTAIAKDLSFLSALSFYYSVSWRVAAGAFEEKGLLGGLTHGFLEYAMLMLIVALTLLVLISLRRNVSGTGLRRETVETYLSR